MINMKKFYSVKNNNNNSNPSSNNIKSNFSASSNNLFDKITRRYSGISTKLLRKSPGRKGHRDVVSGSYNMKGNQSDDLKPEIGLPILISKIDRTDLDDLKKGPHSPSSLSTDDSENDVFVDATCSLHSFSDIHFSFLPDETSSPNSSFDTTSYNLVFTPQNTLHEGPRIAKNKSKSAQNLHRTELKVFLKRPPSLEVIEDFDETCYDLPKKRALNQETTQLNSFETHQSDSSTGVSEPPIVPIAEEKLTYSIQEQLNELPSSQNNDLSCSLNNTSDNLKEISQCQSFRHQSLKSNCSNVTSNSYNDADFDFKSASLQSLNGKNIFMSFDELNEITQQINESEDFNQEIDYEYVEHRDNLKPSERRITLLRNKETNRFINFNEKKDKIAKKWTGVKHWICEERVKFKDVVHRHAALQRVGATHRAESVETNGTADDEESSLHSERRTEIAESSPERQLSSVNGRSSEERQCTVDGSLPGSRKTSLNKSSTHNDSLEGQNGFEELRRYWTGVKHWISEERVKFKDVVHRHAALQRVGATHRAESVETNGTADDEESSLHSERRTEIAESSPERQLSSVNGRSSEERQCTVDGSLPGSRKTSLNKSSTHNDSLEGQNGFEELRRYVKQGGDFGKDLAAILQERIEAEQNYAKSLSKMACKLNKACRDIPGTIADAWRSVSTEMENRSEVHRQFSASLADEIVKPLKTILDNQHKSRKAIETNVDKAVRVLTEWRSAEIKGKKNSHAAARENERLQDQMLDARIQRSPSIALLPHNGASNKPHNAEKETGKEKDCVKLDNKRKKAEEAMKKADVEYYTLCIRAERARVDWEIAVLRGSSMLQSLESQRLGNMKEYAKLYHKFSCDMNPLMDQIVQRIEPQINNCNVQKDLAVLKNIRRAAEGPSEQLLPDFYSEHTTLAMNRERRKQSLVKLLQLIRQDLERERKSRSGLKGFSQTVNNPDNQNITDKLYHIRSMLTYLEGARYKLQSALMELDHRPRGSHPLAQHIQITRDRTGLQQSILKVPLWLRNDENENNDQSMSYEDFDQSCTDAANESPKPETVVIECENERLVEKINAKNKAIKDQNGKFDEHKCESSPTFDRGVADGNSNQPDSDFDEFSSDDEGRSDAGKIDDEPLKPVEPLVIIGKCKALYSYTPKLYDELELFPGDILEIYAKQDDGWWMGGLRNNVGIFPATYVEEIS
uniref:CSON010696 protein n=1 Tax=Culicoides sonorensis TaxID=179676 RepID=A0A336LYN4_CULSO